jgi:hypothetical protein
MKAFPQTSQRTPRLAFDAPATNGNISEAIPGKTPSVPPTTTRIESLESCAPVVNDYEVWVCNLVNILNSSSYTRLQLTRLWINNVALTISNHDQV